MNTNKTNKIEETKMIYQVQKPKKILDPHGVYMEINSDGTIDKYDLSESQVRMLNRGEDILLVKQINLNKYKIEKKNYNKNSEINDTN